MPELLAHSGGRAAFAVLLLVAFVVVRRLMAAPKVDEHHVSVQCTGCGWRGSVSKYKPRCPQCGQPISGR
jgi:hypothetical protein